jgi:tRNA modification GTPase
MLLRLADPIVAIATAPGRGAVGIVRVSSAASIDGLIEALCPHVPRPRHAHYGAFLDARGHAIDHGLALHFPAPASYTGEHVLELQAHGGPVVLQLLLARCLEAASEVRAATGAPRLAGLRVAAPGEFTQRAFLNGKLDLAQAEAVADLIDASTEAAARSAGESLAGAFSREVEALRERIVHLRMLVEATLDFPEEDIDFLRQADAEGQLAAIRDALAATLDRAHQGALLREGIRVVLAGQPNVGKSSLLNALAGAELAIVTPVPGTTRDKVSQTIQIEGVPLHVVDTAGLREAADEVERIGVARSWQAIGEADAVLFLHDLTRRGQPDYDAAEAQIAQRLGLGAAEAEGRRVLHVFNKADAAAVPVLPASAIVLSARRGDGLDTLRRALLEHVGWHAVPEGRFIARSRHVHALRRTAAHLAEAQGHLHAPVPALDLFAEELRLAHDALGEITGRMTADDLLGEIFGRFCIGK